MTSSRASFGSASFAFGTLYFLSLHLFDVLAEAIEARLPELFVVAEPAGGAGERRGVQAHRSRLRLAPARDESRALQHLEMLGDRGLAEIEGGDELAHRGLAAGQAS